MTLHTKLIGGTFALALGLGAMMAPAMAANDYRSQSSYQCTVGETFNGGSITGDDTSTSQYTSQQDQCKNVGRY